MKKTQRLFVAKTKDEIERCHPVMRELRLNLSIEDYWTIYNQAHAADGYEIVAIEDNYKILAVMGYRILHDYVHGKHVYIDDLVTTQEHRSEGLGAQLLDYAENIAREQGCKGLRLCTGIENQRGKQFYERHQWAARALAYKKKL